MKTLTLIRHAKSDWSVEWQSDFDRWLAERWEKQIKEMWKKMKKLELDFDLIICSNAKRTILTLEWLTKIHKDLKKVSTIYMNEIYALCETNGDGVIEIIKKQNKKVKSLAIVWHNLLFDKLVKRFTNTALSVPTLWIVEIIFEIDSWEEITKEWKMTMFLAPEK